MNVIVYGLMNKSLDVNKMKKTHKKRLFIQYPYLEGYWNNLPEEIKGHITKQAKYEYALRQTIKEIKQGLGWEKHERNQ